MSSQSTPETHGPTLLSRVVGAVRSRLGVRARRNDVPKLIAAFIVNHEHRVLYRPVPKAACTTWKAVMAHLAGLQIKSPKMLHDRLQSGLCYLPPQSPRALRRWSRDYFKFTFIRNPWTRTLSAYLNKIERKIGLDPDEHELARYAQQHGLHSFGDFVAHLANSDPLDMNPHWAPQSLLLMLDTIDYDLIGRFENMQEDGGHVLERLGIDRSLTELSRVPHQTNADSRTAKYYTPRLIEEVGRIFAEDVRLGDYRPPEL